MRFDELLQAQWNGYAERHRDRVNLVIHIVAVPLFWVGAIDAVSALLFEGLIEAFGGVLLMALALFAQGIGLDREGIPPEPYAGPWPLAQRIAAEQFITFPRFVISGSWWRQLNAAHPTADSR